MLGIGEIGLNKNTRNEATVFLEHLELAAQTQELVLVHTPHLADKYQGTRMILDMLRDERRIRPSASASTTLKSTRSARRLTADTGWA